METPNKIKQTRENISLATQSKNVATLAFHETGLKENADGMFAFAMHLYQIKSKELWREAECSSFKNYCEVRVPTLFKVVFGRAHLERLATWAEVSEDVSPIGDTEEIAEPPVTESQSRELAKAPKGTRAKVLKDVAKKGPVTAKAIAKQIAEPPKEAEFEELDLAGVPIPKNILAEFQKSREETAEVLHYLSEVRSWLKKELPFQVEISSSALEDVNSAYSAVKQGRGDYVCPVCAGKKCKVCRSRGFVSKAFYKNSIPDEKK